MSKYLDFPMSELTARAMMGDKKAEAYKWIEGYTKNINDRISETSREDEYVNPHEYDADDIIGIALSNEDGASGWGEYISHGGTFEGESVDPMLWDKLSVLLDREVSGSSFFSCSC